MMTIANANGRRIGLGAYVRAVKVAKANPDTTYPSGLTGWWPCTGREILKQFVDGMQERINERGGALRWGSKYRAHKEQHDYQRIWKRRVAALRQIGCRRDHRGF